MASELKVNKLTGVSTAGSIAVTGEGNSTTTNLQQGLIKMWTDVDHVNAEVDDSFNGSGITDNSAGNLTVSYTNPMTSVHRMLCGNDEKFGIGEIFTGSGGTGQHLHRTRGDSTYTGLVDTDSTNSGTFGDLA